MADARDNLHINHSSLPERVDKTARLAANDAIGFSSKRKSSIGFLPRDRFRNHPRWNRSQAGNPDKHFGGWGRLIRHAGLTLSLAVGSLTVAMIQPSFATLLMTPVGRPALLPPCFLAAPVRAVPLPPVTAAANPKQRPACFRSAVSLPEYPAIGFIHPHHRGTGQMTLRDGKLPSPV